ncbi:MAG: response regulator transcription factor, partial [Dehalococcoidia bacterium]
GETIHFVALSGDRLLGILAQAMGETDQAVAHFEDALAFCRKADYRPELAWTCCDYADLLLERAQSAHPEPVEPRAGSQQDRAKAKSLLDESLAISSELGMRPLVERVKERLGQARAKPGTAPAYPDGLSHREVEVLRLITLGKTNQEIGEELFITARTVANHVTNLLNKTDTANRAEAASYATRHELV